jgi:hypothetical protein
MRVIALAFIGLTCSAAVSFAATCEQNFKVDGVPLLTSLSFKSYQNYNGVKSATALRKISQEIAAQGFRGIKINKSLGSVDAFQETTGSGRIQTLRVTAREQGKTTRVDAIFTIQVGQATDKNIVRRELCKIINSAR